LVAIFILYPISDISVKYEWLLESDAGGALAVLIIRYLTDRRWCDHLDLDVRGIIRVTPFSSVHIHGKDSVILVQGKPQDKTYVTIRSDSKECKSIVTKPNTAHSLDSHSLTFPKAATT
jgi:hypothetical protein